MGVEVRFTQTEVEVAIAAARRIGLLDGAKAVLAVSDVLAPREDEPRHGVHMTETGFTRIEPGDGVDTAMLGYRAFWAVYQEEDLTYHHPDGGQAKFLSTAVSRGAGVVEEAVAARLRGVIG